MSPFFGRRKFWQRFRTYKPGVFKILNTVGSDMLNCSSSVILIANNREIIQGVFGQWLRPIPFLEASAGSIPVLLL